MIAGFFPVAWSDILQSMRHFGKLGAVAGLHRALPEGLLYALSQPGAMGQGVRGGRLGHRRTPFVYPSRRMKTVNERESI